MTTVNIFEAKSQLSKLVQAVETGQEEEIIIARNGRPVARLAPLKEKRGGVYDQFPVEIRSDRPKAFLSAPESSVAVDGKNYRLDEHILWIAAEDA